MIKVKRLPAGFVVPAQPVKAPKPPVGTDWIHEIKHDGYRMIVRVSNGFNMKRQKTNVHSGRRQSFRSRILRTMRPSLVPGHCRGPKTASKIASTLGSCLRAKAEQASRILAGQWGPDRRSPSHTVDRDSARWLNKAVYERARLFRREFHFDFVQRLEQGPRQGPDKSRAFLFVDDRSVIAGAYAFQWLVYTDAPSGWTGDWVWLAPRFRRRGILTKAWPYFTELFGGFHLERPLSRAMAAFVTKIGHRKPIDLPRIASRRTLSLSPADTDTSLRRITSRSAPLYVTVAPFM
jgi:hypothetical protein